MMMTMGIKTGVMISAIDFHVMTMTTVTPSMTSKGMQNSYEQNYYEMM